MLWPTSMCMVYLNCWLGGLTPLVGRSRPLAPSPLRVPVTAPSYFCASSPPLQSLRPLPQACSDSGSVTSLWGGSSTTRLTSAGCAYVSFTLTCDRTCLVPPSLLPPPPRPPPPLRPPLQPSQPLVPTEPYSPVAESPRNEPPPWSTPNESPTTGVLPPLPNPLPLRVPPTVPTVLPPRPGCLYVSKVDGKMYSEAVLADSGNVTVSAVNYSTIQFDISLQQYFPLSGSRAVRVDLSKHPIEETPNSCFNWPGLENSMSFSAEADCDAHWSRVLVDVSSNFPCYSDTLEEEGERADRGCAIIRKYLSVGICVVLAWVRVDARRL